MLKNEWDDMLQWSDITFKPWSNQPSLGEVNTKIYKDAKIPPVQMPG